MITKFSRYAATAILFALTLSACSSNTGTERVLTQESADSLASQLAESNGYLVRAFSNPTDFNAGAENARAAALSAAGLNLEPLAYSCDVEESNNTTDADRDGIPVDASHAIDCRYTSDSDQSSISITGATRTTDKDDNDKRSGFTTQTDTYTIRLTDAEGRAYSSSLDLDIDVTLQSDRYAADLNFAFELANPAERGRVAYNYDASYVPDDASAPFAGGTFSYDGSLEFSNDRDRYALSADVNNLRYSETCSSGFTGGSATYMDTAGSSLEITYNGCGNYTKNFRSGTQTSVWER